MILAYVRVSTAEQHEDRQIAELSKRYDVDKWYTEKVSGATTNRPKLQQMIAEAMEMRASGKDVTIVIHELSRLGRNTADLLTLVNRFEQANISLISNKENLDTSTATGKLMLGFLANIAEFERNLLKERQAEGIKQAKAKGVYEQRAKKFRKEISKADYERLKNKEITKKDLAYELDVTRATLDAMIKRYENRE